MQHAPGKPNDDRADEHLHGHVCELVILHWSKLPAIHVKEVSECIDLQCDKDERQQPERNLNVETNADVEIEQCQKNKNKDRIESEREIKHFGKEGCAAAD